MLFWIEQGRCASYVQGMGIKCCLCWAEFTFMVKVSTF